MQAGGEGLPCMAHRAVIAHVGNAGDRVFGNDDRVGDIGAAVTVKVLEHWQQRKVHGFAFEDFIQHRAGFHVARGDGVVGALLESLVQLRRGNAEHPGDAGAGGEQVGDHRRAEVADFSQISSGSRPWVARVSTRAVTSWSAERDCRTVSTSSGYCRR